MKKQLSDEEIKSILASIKDLENLEFVSVCLKNNIDLDIDFSYDCYMEIWT